MNTKHYNEADDKQTLEDILFRQDVYAKYFDHESGEWKTFVLSSDVLLSETGAITILELLP